MRRADRLFRIVEYLKARRHVVKASDMAKEMKVSVRTIYRDIADLNRSDVPIIGEAGVGYMIDRNFIVRPLMFDLEELDALMLGARMVKSWSDISLSGSAQSAMDKIGSVLPEVLRQELNDNFLFSFPSRAKNDINIDFGTIRKAIRNKNKIGFRYKKEGGESSLRSVRPLALAFFGPVWLLLGWCETRHDFRNFRLDRMEKMIVSDLKFEDKKGRTLRDYIRQEKKKK